MEARCITTPLCRLADLLPGRSRGFDPLGEGKDTMFLVLRNGVVHGWRNACPHYDYASMAWKKDEFLDANGAHIMCAAHGALFDIQDGRCILGPCLGQSLTPVPLRITGGLIFIDGLYAPGLRKNRKEKR